MNPETRALVRERGFSIWLRADIEVLLRRVSRRGGRPLLAGGDPREVLTRLIEERYPVYGEADIVVDTTDAPHATVVNDILRTLMDHPQCERLFDEQPATELRATC